MLLLSPPAPQVISAHDFRGRGERKSAEVLACAIGRAPRWVWRGHAASGQTVFFFFADAKIAFTITQQWLSFLDRRSFTSTSTSTSTVYIPGIYYFEHISRDAVTLFVILQQQSVVRLL